MLNGQTILIVEEEFLIALDIQRVLESMQAKETVFARSADEALCLVKKWPDFGLALIEFQNDNATTFVLAQGLRNAGIALVLTASDSTLRRGASKLSGTPVVIKPFLEDDLMMAVRKALQIQADEAETRSNRVDERP